MQSSFNHPAYRQPTDEFSSLHTIAETYGREVSAGKRDALEAHNALHDVLCWHHTSRPLISSNPKAFDALYSRVQKTFDKYVFYDALQATYEIKIALQIQLKRGVKSVELRNISYGISASRLSRDECDLVVKACTAKYLRDVSKRL